MREICLIKRNNVVDFNAAVSEKLREGFYPDCGELANHPFFITTEGVEGKTFYNMLMVKEGEGEAKE